MINKNVRPLAPNEASFARQIKLAGAASSIGAKMVDAASATPAASSFFRRALGTAAMALTAGVGLAAGRSLIDYGTDKYSEKYTVGPRQRNAFQEAINSTPALQAIPIDVHQRNFGVLKEYAPDLTTNPVTTAALLGQMSSFDGGLSFPTVTAAAQLQGVITKTRTTESKSDLKGNMSNLGVKIVGDSISKVISDAIR